jgi:hypothetical protein
MVNIMDLASLYRGCQVMWLYVEHEG